MNRHRALTCYLSMISAQTLRVCREGKPVSTRRVVARGHAFPDHALASLRQRLPDRDFDRRIVAVRARELERLGRVKRRLRHEARNYAVVHLRGMHQERMAEID